MTLSASNDKELVNPSAIEDLIPSLANGRQKWQACREIHFAAALEELLQNNIPLTEIIQRSASQLEKQIILDVLVLTKGNKSMAAKILKIDYKTLYRKIQRYAI